MKADNCRSKYCFLLKIILHVLFLFVWEIKRYVSANQFLQVSAWTYVPYFLTAEQKCKAKTFGVQSLSWFCLPSLCLWVYLLSSTHCIKISLIHVYFSGWPSWNKDQFSSMQYLLRHAESYAHFHHSDPFNLVQTCKENRSNTFYSISNDIFHKLLFWYI